ncbi:T9SS type A sorting domain-containing protein [Rufibacter radiotolerans]|uniref:T9SS type A sorting domain-containing protein n=1 Tax=Rufibacter radiotolerans TaxID=1379910 RepID=UPI0018CD12CC|nr:T9SS type A sorting domain-containing protein [Rufibacter radiotolerans]
MASFAGGRKSNPSGISARKGETTKALNLKTFGTVGPPSLRTGETWKPRNATVYMWMYDSWDLDIKYELIYDAQGRLIEEKGINPFENVNFSRTTFAFDSRGNETEALSYQWVNNAWVLKGGSKSTYTYTNNKLTQYVSQYYNGQAWVSNEKYEYTYNASGNIESEAFYYWENNAWVPNLKFVYQYTNATQPPTTVLLQAKQGEAWVTLRQVIDIQWHASTIASKNYFGLFVGQEPGSFLVQNPSGSNWVNYFRQSTTYSANDSYVITTEEFSNQNWVFDERTTMQFDSHKNLVVMQEEEYTAGQWVVTSGSKYANTYDGDKLTELIYQAWDKTSKTYKNNQRIVFSNFQAILSAKEELQLAAQVYPNPVQDRFSLKLDQNTGGLVKVVSLAGKTLLSTELSRSAGEQEINIAGLPAGTYILQIHSKAGVRTKKITKL